MRLLQPVAAVLTVSRVCPESVDVQRFATVREPIGGKNSHNQHIYAHKQVKEEDEFESYLWKN
jgi:hypothetical protein